MRAFPELKVRASGFPRLRIIFTQLGFAFAFSFIAVVA
jgi:hypothetical protein